MMTSFEYYTPTEVVFGKGRESEAGALVKKYGGKKALIHYGGGSAKRSGLIDRVKASLDAAGVEYIELGGVQPNPRLSLVREGIELCKKEGVDFLLAVGGGSTIDSSKAIAYGLANDCDVWDLYAGKSAPEACYPVSCVLTIAAAGSEMSNSSVITNDETLEKRGVTSDFSRCRFAIMNPELTYSLPAFQTASGITDIIYHTMERYFSSAMDVEPTDSMAEGLMRAVMAAAPKVLENPEDYDARACIMWAGSLSHNNLTGCGRFSSGRGDWASHQLEHELSGMFDVTHGAGLAAVWGAWSRYVYKEAPSRFARFARNVLGVSEADDEKAALAGIEKYEDFLRSIGMPTKISGLGIELTDAQTDELAKNCSYGGKRTIGSFKKLDESDMRNIYALAR